MEVKEITNPDAELPPIESPQTVLPAALFTYSDDDEELPF